MLEIFDEYRWTKEQKLLTKSEHRVPGLGNFTHWNSNSSTPPSPLHIHSNIFEIHCMINGVRHTQIKEDTRFKNYETKGNQAIVVFPFEIHSNGTLPQPPCEFFAFQVDVSNPYKILGLDKAYSTALYQNLTQLKHHQYELNQTHISYLRTAFNFFSEKNEDMIKIGVQYITVFLFTLQLLTPIAEQNEIKIDKRFSDVIEYINDNITNKIELREVANIAGYSLSRFKYKFHEQIGITPSEYITLSKMAKAKKYLADTDDSITYIAYSLGFSSSNYFSTVFKKINGITPNQYRSLRN